MNDFSLKIDIPKPNDTAFQAGFKDILRTLSITEKKLKNIDRLIKKTGSGVGSVGRGRGGRGGGGGRGRRRATGNNSAFGEGNSGRLPSVLRAAGVGGELAVAAGAINPVSAAVIALTVAIKGSINVASQFEKSLGEISRVARFTGEEMRNFGEDVASLSTRLPVGTAQIFKLASAGANAGLGGRQLSVFTAEMAKLATILPNISETQVRGILRLGTLTGFPIERIGELNGMLVRLQQNTKATLPELIKLSQRIAQDAGIFGISTKEVGTLAASIADLGLPPERASTAIGRLTGKLKNLDALGRPAVQRLVNTFKTPIDVDKFLDLAKNDPVKAMELIGEESVNLMASLNALQITGKQATLGTALLRNLERYKEIKANTELGDGIIDDQVTSRLKEFSAQWDIFVNKLQDGLRQVGAFFTSILTPMLKFFNTLDEKIEAAKRALDGLATFLLTFNIDLAVEAANGGLPQDNRVKLINKLTKDMGALRSEAKRLRAEFGDTPAVIQWIKELDEEAGPILEKFSENFRKAGGSEEQLAKIMKNNLAPGVVAGLEAMSRKSRDFYDAIASGAQKAVQQLSNIAKATADTQFQIDIFDLDESEKRIREIARNAQQEFSALVGTEVLTPEQITNLKKELEKNNLASFKLDVTQDTKTVLKELDDLSRGDLSPAQKAAIDTLRTVLNALDQSAKVVTAAQGKRNAEYNLLLKQEAANLLKEQQNIANSKAPAVAAITDAGAAVELLNQQRLDTEIQNQELLILEEANVQRKEQIELAKRTKFKVAVPR